MSSFFFWKNLHHGRPTAFLFSRFLRFWLVRPGYDVDRPRSSSQLCMCPTTRTWVCFRISLDFKVVFHGTRASSQRGLSDRVQLPPVVPNIQRCYDNSVEDSCSSDHIRHHRYCRRRAETAYFRVHPSFQWVLCLPIDFLRLCYNARDDTQPCDGSRPGDRESSHRLRHHLPSSRWFSNFYGFLPSKLIRSLKLWQAFAIQRLFLLYRRVLSSTPGRFLNILFIQEGHTLATMSNSGEVVVVPILTLFTCVHMSSCCRDYRLKRSTLSRDR